MAIIDFNNLRPRVPRTFKSLRVNEGLDGGRWANHDVLPVPEEGRTFGWKAYFAYWYRLGLLSLPLTINAWLT